MSSDKVWDVLEHRDRQRILWSRLQSRSLAPENVYYSVANSLKHRHLNRYSDILAYDRTAIKVEGEYLNANVVRDGRGGQWVASQVRMSACPRPCSCRSGAHTRGYATLLQGLASCAEGRASSADRLAGWSYVKGRSIYAVCDSERSDTLLSSRTPEQEGTYRTGAGETITVRSGPTAYSADLASHRTALTITSDREGSKSIVDHFYFAGWPDHGVPKREEREALSGLIRTVEASREDGSEVWVHW